MTSLYGQATPLLKEAIKGKANLYSYIEAQIEGYSNASQLLHVK